MQAGPFLGLLVALPAASVWTWLGLPLARRAMPRGIPPLCGAPLLGWALHVAIVMTAATALPGPHPPLVGVALGLACLGISAGLSCLLGRHSPSPARLARGVPVAAILLGLLPATALLPKFSAHGIFLSAPIFDHVKIALIDAIARQGAPPVNPFMGGEPPVAYYWWWHGSAAALASLSGTTGWAADVALTWFTATAVLLLIAGIAHAQGGPRAAVLAVLLALPGGLRPLLPGADSLLMLQGGLGGWLNQASWAPQHLAAAGCLILAVLVLARLARVPDWRLAILLSVLVATGFACSVWVGGIVCALAMPAAAAALWPVLARRHRRPLLYLLAAAAALSLAIVAPLLVPQLRFAALHAGGIGLGPYRVLQPGAGPFADLAGFPLLMLITFPVAATAGLCGASRTWFRGAPGWQRALLAAACASLLVCQFAHSTIENNDLGWRAILPCLLVLIALAATPVLGWWQHRGTRRALALALPVLGLAGLWPQLQDTLFATTATAPLPIAAEQALWRDIRAYVPGNERIGSDPRLDAGATFWPANIGWATLSDRAACYAGWASVHPFARIPAPRLYAQEQAVWRVFDGLASPEDEALMADGLACDFIVVTPRSPAYAQDRIADGSRYTLLAQRPGVWKLYARR